MAIFDIIDEISEKQIMKTETGEERIFGVVVGLVAENYDKDMPGRVCVTIPVRDKEANVLKWAKMVPPYSGSKWGQYFLPEKGDQVLLAFEYGQIEKPYVIGSVPKDQDSFLTKSADESNQVKKIVTRNGNEIAFEDNKEGEGKKDKISISTPGKAHTVVLDNENKKITVMDKESNCKLEMKTENGQINLIAAKKITIEVGDTIKIIMNGENGTVQVKADKILAEASKKLECKSDGNAKFSGQQTVIEASSSLKNSSNGMVTVSGSPIKIG